MGCCFEKDKANINGNRYVNKKLPPPFLQEREAGTDNVVRDSALYTTRAQDMQLRHKLSGWPKHLPPSPLLTH